MKFQILSDLHLEFIPSFRKKWDFINSLKTNADYVLLAGDISTGKNIAKDYNLVKDNLGDIIFVAGNHEYYNSSKRIVDDILRNDVDGIFLDNDVTIVGDVTIIGGTGWNSSFNDSASRMNDFKLISDLVLDKYASVDWNNDTYNFFEKTLHQNYDKKVICLTHNAPLLNYTPYKYKGDDLNVFFANDWNDLFKHEPELWISGHLHQSLDMVYFKTRCIENSFGYFNSEENVKFNKQLLIEV